LKVTRTIFIERVTTLANGLTKGCYKMKMVFKAKNTDLDFLMNKDKSRLGEPFITAEGKEMDNTAMISDKEFLYSRGFGSFEIRTVEYEPETIMDLDTQKLQRIVKLVKNAVSW
jgi:hypothetical protein